MAKNGLFLRLERSEMMVDVDDLSSRGNDSEKVHVLAVDDSLVDRKVIEGLLRITSFKVTAVDSGWRALQFLGLDRDENSVELDRLKVDLIITDYCMPGMTGYELMKKIKGSSTFRKVPVVIMSSENVLARTLRCLEEGAEDFIVKPVKLSDIKRLKRAMFGEGSNDDSMKKPDDNSEKPPPAQSPSPLPSIDSTPSSSFPNSPQSDWPLLLSPTSPLPLLKDKDVEGNPSMDHPHSLLEILLNGKDCDRNTPKDSQSPPLEILLEDKDIDRNPPKDQHSSLEAILVDKDNDDRNAP